MAHIVQPTDSGGGSSAVCLRTRAAPVALALVLAKRRPADKAANHATLRHVRPGITATRLTSSLAVKYALDGVLSAVLLMLCGPLFILIALAIKATSPGPVFFVQKRVGRAGRTFDFYKFRTMRHACDDTVHREFAREFIRGGRSERRGQNGIRGGTAPTFYKLARDPRVTPIGRFLRRTSLDELPQLFNILRGDMSLVGPRPPLLYELEYYQDWHKRRLSVRPGLTGLWQVTGRSRVPFDTMVQLDLDYIDHWSMWMDFRLLAKTLPVVLTGRGAY